MRVAITAIRIGAKIRRIYIKVFINIYIYIERERLPQK